jgi:hypothetical protein
MVHRMAAGAVGVGLIALAVLAAGVIRDSAVASMFAIGGVALVLWAFVAERLKSVGPRGVELFEETRERTAQVAPSDRDAAEIRAAESPEQLAEVLGQVMERLARLERPEKPWEAMQRAGGDEPHFRKTAGRYGRSRRIGRE